MSSEKNRKAFKSPAFAAIASFIAISFAIVACGESETAAPQDPFGLNSPEAVSSNSEAFAPSSSALTTEPSSSPNASSTNSDSSTNSESTTNSASTSSSIASEQVQSSGQTHISEPAFSSEQTHSSEKTATSSSSIAVSSSEKAISSSSNIAVYSSAKATSSSSSRTAYSSTQLSPFATWLGIDGVERVETGYDAGSEHSGFWYTFDDNLDRGLSKIIWPVPLGNEYDPNSLQPVIEAYGGVYGKAVLDKGNLHYDPFVGIAFDMVGPPKDNIHGKLLTADATNMGGLCVSYASEAPLIIELGLGDKKDEEIQYNLPFFKLRTSGIGTTEFIPWSEFKQNSWGTKYITGEEAAKTIATIRFKIQGRSGSTPTFIILSIGPLNYGECNDFGYGMPMVWKE